MMIKAWNCGWILACLWLAACATVPATDVTPSQWEARTAQIQSYATIGYDARLHIQADNQSWHFSMVWEQSGERFTGKGFSTFGTQIFSIEGNERTTSYDEGEGATTLSSREAIKEFTGLDLLPSQLFAVITALPLSGGEQSWKSGKLAMQQLGTIRIDYLDWNEFNQLLMPQKVHIQNKNDEITFRFSDWTYRNQASQTAAATAPLPK